jgi:hypothetical protein
MSKIYCGNGKAIVYNDPAALIAVMLDLDVLNQNFEEHGFTSSKGRRKIKVKVCRGRMEDAYGNSHYVEIDTWKPGDKAANQSNNAGTQKPDEASRKPGDQAGPLPMANLPSAPPDDFDDDIPF